jgi:putative adenylate-forming enzyme
MRDAAAVLYHYLRARHRRPFRSRVEIECWQTLRFQEFAQQVLVRSPFYRPYVGKPLAEYPIVDKATMMAAFDRMNTRGLSRDMLMSMALRAEETRDFTPMAGDVSVGLSSGTSGQRGLFVASRRERRQYAGTVLAKALPGSLLERHRIALLLRANNALYEATGSGRVAFRFFDLLLPLPEVLRRLAVFAPDVLVGPPQALRLVAEGVRHGGPRLAPRKIIAGAEVLDPKDAAEIEAVFGQRVDQIYQATEGFLGITCEEGTLHLNEELVHIEKRWVDRPRGRFMPIVTDFVRTTQPIVRYALDDLLVERPDPCPCGSATLALSRIEGRADDVLLAENADGQPIAILPDFVRDALSACSEVIPDYRVIQWGRTDIELQVDGSDPLLGAAVAVAALDGVFDRFGARRPEIRAGGPVVHDPRHKLRRVQRRFPLPAHTAWPAS